MSTEKKEVAKVVTLPKTAEPKKESANTSKAQNITEILENQLKEIKRKKKLADRRDVFMAKSEELGECLAALQEEQAGGSFSTDNFTLIFARKNGYSDKEAFRISNPTMMLKFLVALQAEMLQAIKAIETELIREV